MKIATEMHVIRLILGTQRISLAEFVAILVEDVDNKISGVMDAQSIYNVSEITGSDIHRCGKALNRCVSVES